MCITCCHDCQAEKAIDKTVILLHHLLLCTLCSMLAANLFVPVLKLLITPFLKVGILVGKNGVAMKKLGQQARGAIESFLDRPVSKEFLAALLGYKQFTLLRF
jgi:hypothetical protein